MSVSYPDYMFWRTLGFSAAASYRIAKYGFFNFVIDMDHPEGI